jgi:hypothetical protein
MRESDQAKDNSRRYDISFHSLLFMTENVFIYIEGKEVVRSI